MDDEDDESVQTETQKMKAFFKKSKIYNKFVQEKAEEERED